MKMTVWRLFPLLIFVLLAVFLWRGLSLDPHYLPSAQLNQSLPSFQLEPLHPDQGMLSSKLFKGQIVLLNVWASWCAACEEEQVFLLQLAREGVRIYGLDYKDVPERARQWLIDFGNPYQNIGQDKTGKIAIELGVYGAPETFLIDPKGMIRHRHTGVLTASVWQDEFLPRIHALELKK